MPLSFRGTLQASRGMFVEVPQDIVDALAAGRRPPVRVIVNGVELRTTLAVYGGRSYIGFRREIRDAAHIEPGESIEIHVELDQEERSVEVPPELAEALAADADAGGIFDGLSFTNRKEYVGWIVSARKPETRLRRIAEVPGLLKKGRETPL